MNAALCWLFVMPAIVVGLVGGCILAVALILKLLLALWRMAIEFAECFVSRMALR